MRVCVADAYKDTCSTTTEQVFWYNFSNLYFLCYFRFYLALCEYLGWRKQVGRLESEWKEERESEWAVCLCTIARCSNMNLSVSISLMVNAQLSTGSATYRNLCEIDDEWTMYESHWFNGCVRIHTNAYSMPMRARAKNIMALSAVLHIQCYVSPKFKTTNQVELYVRLVICSCKRIWYLKI